MNPLEYLKALYTFLTMSIESRFPSTRRALSPRFALFSIIAIIIIGGVIILVLVVSPGVTTRSTYP